MKNSKLDLALNEANQLMAIFLKSIETAKNNQIDGNKRTKEANNESASPRKK